MKSLFLYLGVFLATFLIWAAVERRNTPPERPTTKQEAVGLHWLNDRIWGKQE